MQNWLAKFLGRPPAQPALRGTPPVRRVKHYAALSGYAYEYAFEGYRDDGPHELIEYVFSISGDRQSWRELPVAVSSAGLRSWELETGRTLASNVRYAIAKLALFGAFDDAESPQSLTPRIEVQADSIAAILERLDF